MIQKWMLIGWVRLLFRDIGRLRLLFAKTYKLPVVYVQQAREFTTHTFSSSDFDVESENGC